jgi:hypothetical protein
MPRTAPRSSSRNRARPPTRWRRCAIAARPGRRSSHRQPAGKHDRARGRRVLPTLAGPEIGVASTKAFTTQLAVLAASRSRWRGRAARSTRRRRRARRPARRGAVARQRGPAPRRADAGDRRRDRAGPRRALSRPRHLLSAGARRRAEAEGDLLHPRRGLCRRRDEARADRADRRQRAGHRRGAARRSVREDLVEYRGGHARAAARS